MKEDVDTSTLFYLTFEGEKPPPEDPSTCQSSNSGTRGIDEEDSQENTDCDQAMEEVELHQEFILTEVEIEIEAQQTSEGLSS